MSKLFYRFRKTQNIFDFKELENQEIYFASNKELNDPMEGFKNLVFNGDKIVWRNLLNTIFYVCSYEMGEAKQEHLHWVMTSTRR